MDVTEFLKTRTSTPWRILGDPGPSEAEVREFLEAAVAVPDHGAVRPWRFVVVHGEAREAMGAVLTDALLKRKPDADEATIEKDRDRMRQVPLMIAVAARIMPNHPKVPPTEQIVSAGLAAYSILLSAESKGYGAVMLTGDHAYDKNVKKGLGLRETDDIIAFIYIGTPQSEPRAKKRLDPAKVTIQWTGAKQAPN